MEARESLLVLFTVWVVRPVKQKSNKEIYEKKIKIKKMGVKKGAF